jgi:hypothetical protein
MELACGIAIFLGMLFSNGDYNTGYDKGFNNGKIYAEQNIGRSMDKSYRAGYTFAKEEDAQKVIDLSIGILINRELQNEQPTSNR